MSGQGISFDDGEAYERFMGRWSRLAGEVFLDWLAPAPGLRWVDIGCGNGAFTELLFERAGAAHVDGVDPSAGQLAFASERLQGRPVTLQRGSATALPFADATFDAAAMALVIFFVPTPEDGVAEMVRVTRPGGIVAAYAWDMPGGGFPLEPARDALRQAGIEPLAPPRADVAAMPALRGLWTEAGLEAVTTRTIEVEREFADFAEWWSSCRGAASLAAALDQLPPAEAARLQDGLRERLRPDADGRIRYPARANAIAGVRPR
ncbi:MAG: methyltransferase domain-containing protein [Acetobacteraceae bacterium]|nr:methyltransferase domain-containing protein [Acetobacteraceae bacterium]